MSEIKFLAELNQTIEQANQNERNSLLIHRSSLLMEQGYLDLAMDDCLVAWENQQTIEAALCINKIYLVQEDYIESIRWISSAMTSFDSLFSLRYILAESLIALKRNKEAFAVLQKDRLGNISCFAAYNIAKLLNGIAYQKEALAFCTSSCQQTVPEIALLKVHIMIELKNPATLELLNKIAENPMYTKQFLSDIQYLYGNYWFSQKQHDKAIEYYENAASIEWRFQSAYVGKAQSLRALNRYEEALEQLTIASEVAAPTKTIMQETSECFLALGDSAEALSYLQAAQRLDPNDTKLKKKLLALKP